MRKGRISLVGAFLVVALWASTSFAAEPSQISMLGGSCLPAAMQAPDLMWLHARGCYQMSDCMDDDYCWGLCPTATAAACVNNVCQFTLPGGGGGPGGVGCPEQRDCVDESHCVYFGGITGACINNVCVC